MEDNEEWVIDDYMKRQLVSWSFTNFSQTLVETPSQVSLFDSNS